MTVASAYPTYRRTDLNWFECVPESWAILRTKQMFRLVIERAPENNQMELLSVYTHIGVRPRKSLEQRGNKASTTDGYWVVKKGDIICNKLLAWMGAIGVSHYEGVTSPAYDILRPLKSCNTDYYHFLFRTKKYLQQFKLRSRGIMDMRLRLYFDQFGQIPIPVPPRPEQDQIVAYLRAQDAHIARFIKTKRDLIKLLTEQKLRIIDHAVTHGLDASVTLKPSGIEWLGEVPEHWEVAFIKHIADVRFSGVDKHSHDHETPVRLCNYTDVYKNDRITGDMDLMRATATEAEIARLTLKAGDVILTKDSETPDDIGVPAWVPENLPGVVCAYHLGLLRPVPNRVLGEFLFRAIGSARTAQQFHVLATGVTRFALGKHDVKNAVVALPPVEEQQSICRWITNECQPLDDAIARTEEEIKLIREYRDRLIADVVTGQMDVRGWLYPDVVGMEDLSKEWHREVRDCVTQYSDKRTKLWSFEAKLLINRSNVRECFFQAVSNSSWANFGYLVAAEIDGTDTLKELRMLFAAHGIGFIKLDVENPADSQVLIPTRERDEIDWDMVSRLAREPGFSGIREAGEAVLPDRRGALGGLGRSGSGRLTVYSRWPMTSRRSSPR